MQYVQLNKMISEPCTPRHKRKLFSLKFSFGYAMRKPHGEKNLEYTARNQRVETTRNQRVETTKRDR